MNKKQKEIVGLLLIIFSIISIISLLGHTPTETIQTDSKEWPFTNPLGIVGIFLSSFLFYLLGYPSIIFPLIIGVIGSIIFRHKKLKNSRKYFLYILLFGLWIATFIAYVAGWNDPAPGSSDYAETSNYYNQAGIIGNSIYVTLVRFFGFIGITLFLFFSMFILLTTIFKVSILELYTKIVSILSGLYYLVKSIFLNIFKIKKLFKRKDSSIVNMQENQTENNNSDNLNNIKSEVLDEEIVVENADEKEEENTFTEEESGGEEEVKNEDNAIIIEEEEIVEYGDLEAHHKENQEYFKYKLPKIEYLNNPIEIVKQSEDELIEKGKQLKYALNTFGVDGEIVKISPGPIISLFEIEPAEGVRVNKFTNLSDDLARVMKAQRVRIIAPIPGSKSVGIELPNENTSIVYLRTILNSTRYIESESKLTIALGKTTSGDAYTFDLCKMPHLLIAGATGAGKSVCINTIILSILYKAKPDEVKFILLDPKKIELSTYKSLVGYHLITAPNLDEYVMTTSENAVGILNSAINEMERRFQVFSDARVRNIQEYHIKCKKNKTLESIPYVVVLIDELADLMMTSGRAIEEPITRLAQKARAVGIHLVVATQRPSVDVITGLIKSNFPSRISFLVSSKVDSRTILDQMGAEKLLGRGDMLFLLPGSSSPLRVHNAYVTLEEIEKIMKHILSQPRPNEIKLPEVQAKKQEVEFDLGDRDELLKDAAKLVIEHQQASVSMLQRKFRIGYSRAGRLIDELESLGIISGYSGSKARNVLVDLSYLNEIFD